MVGPVASILWLLSYKILERFHLDDRRNNKLSAMTSLISCPLVLALIDDGDFSKLFLHYALSLPFILPVAFASYLVYQYLFIGRISKLPHLTSTGN